VLKIFLLGFSSGLPLALTASTLQAWFTVAGVDILSIGALSLVAQPYVYKFLWAPLMDRFTLPFLGRRRGWMLVTQSLLLVTLVGFSMLNPAKNPVGMALLAVVVAFLSASQDIVVDAYRIEILKPEERGMGAAWFVNGYRIAMIASGGFALILADQFGWSMTYLFMGFFMVTGLLATCFSPEPNIPHSSPPATLRQAVIDPFRQFLSRDQAVLFLLLILLYRLGDGFTLNLTSTFLLRGLGFSLTVVGTFYKTIGVAATLLGLLLGGWLMKRLTLLEALLRFGIAQAVSVLGFVALSLTGKSMPMLCIAIGMEYFCNGMAIAAFTVLMMSLCDPRYTATQFAVLSALSAVGRVFIGPLAATVAEHAGWTYFYLWSFLIYLFPIFLIISYKPTFLAQQGISYAE
jgi:MFS transporter, PAT family, beta-lactamase induction signal transducer AmpG